MRLQWPAIFLLMLVVPARAQMTPAQGRTPTSIKPGITRAAVWKHIGEPTVIHFLHARGRTYTWDEWITDRREWTVISRRGRVVQTEYRIHDDGRLETFTAFRLRQPHPTVRLYELRDEVGAAMVADDIRRGVAWTLYVHHPDSLADSLDLYSGTPQDPMNVQPLRVISHLPGHFALPSNIGDKPMQNTLLLHTLRVWFAAKASRG